MLRTILALTAALALSVPAAAHHCTTWSTSNAVELDGTYVYDACVDYAAGNPAAGKECAWWGPWSVWVYEEANGIPGLQRADEMVDDTCHGLIMGDQVVF